MHDRLSLYLENSADSPDALLLSMREEYIDIAIRRYKVRAINSMKFNETSRFAFDSYFGRRYLGYLVSPRDYHPHGPDSQKDLLVKSSRVKNYASRSLFLKDEPP